MKITRSGGIAIALVLALIVWIYLDEGRYASCKVRVDQEKEQMVIEFPTKEKITTIEGVEIKYTAAGYVGTEEVDPSYKESLQGIKQTRKVVDGVCFLVLHKDFYFMKGGGEVRPNLKFKVLVNGKLKRFIAQEPDVTVHYKRWF